MFTIDIVLGVLKKMLSEASQLSNSVLTLQQWCEMIIEAFQVYKEAKKVSIKLVADQWKSKIEDKVYQSLLNWEITFDD